MERDVNNTGLSMTYISLFSGIGGFDLGFQRAGMHCVLQVEWDKAASGVLQHHWPAVNRLGDVRNVIQSSFSAVDLICGGSPCQDISVAGNRAGLVGEQSRLFFEFVRVLEEVKPTWFVFENVENLLWSNDGRDFAIVLLQLVKCGYCIGWRVLDAQYFGIPQRRKRVFIVGHSRNGSAAKILFESESLPGDIDKSEPQKETASSLTRSGHSGTSGSVIRNGIRIYDARGNGSGNLCPTLVGDHMGRITDYTPIVHDPDNGVRRLTPVECERLQGFPDGWTAVNDQSDSKRYKQLGNAVAVPVAEWIGRRIVAANGK